MLETIKEINIKEEVYKCSKCGLCQSVCPIFLAAKNELYLARGRYNILNNFFNNEKELSKKFIKELDICLNCNACMKFCPSSINSANIFTKLKSLYNKSFVQFSTKYKFILYFHSLKKYLSKNQLYKINVKRNSEKISVKKANVVYFQGCFNKYINPSDKNASINLLKENGFNVIKIIDNCCGLPYLSDGNLKEFEKNAQKIIKLIPQNTDYVIVSCESCYKTLLEVFKKTKIKLLKIDELIETKTTAPKTFFFKPFSLDEYKGNLPIINKKGSSSLMENFFMLKYPKITKKYLNSVFFDKKELEGKILITTCNLTKWGLIELCKQKGINTQIYSNIEYFFNYYANHVDNQDFDCL